MRRKGLGKRKGKGYKNIMSTDSVIHSMSAKGIKQPQKIKKINLIDKFAEDQRGVVLETERGTEKLLKTVKLGSGATIRMYEVIPKGLGAGKISETRKKQLLRQRRKK